MSSDLFYPGPGQNTVIANIRDNCCLTPSICDPGYLTPVSFVIPASEPESYSDGSFQESG